LTASFSKYDCTHSEDHQTLFILNVSAYEEYFWTYFHIDTYIVLLIIIG
jgi:hypothetical protein